MNEEHLNFYAEKKAWLEKFEAATPEEQKKMLGEKAANREREEEERRKRIYEHRKEKFFKKSDEQIAAYELLKKAFLIALKISSEFDGKVLNNRLTKKIDEVVREKVNEHVCAELEISYSYNLKNNIGKMTIHDYTHYGCEDCVYFYIVIDSSERIMWEETLAYMEKNGYKPIDLDNRISERKKAKKNYDRIYKKAKKVEAMISDYSNEDYFLRDFFRSENVIYHSTL